MLTSFDEVRLVFYMHLETKILFLFFVFSKIGEEQSPEDAEDGPPELLVSSKATNIFNTYQHFFLYYCS